jgi:hypothetical protein
MGMKIASRKEMVKAFSRILFLSLLAISALSQKTFGFRLKAPPTCELALKEIALTELDDGQRYDHLFTDPGSQPIKDEATLRKLLGEFGSRKRENMIILAQTFIPAIFKAMHELDSVHPVLVQELYLRLVEEILPRFDESRTQGYAGKTLQKKLTAFILAELRREIRKYHNPRYVSRNGMLEFNRRAELADPIDPDHETPNDPLDLLADPPDEQIQRFGRYIDKMDRIERLRDFMNFLRRFPDKTPDEQNTYELVFILRVLQGDPDLIRSLGIRREIPPPPPRNFRDWNKVTWDTREVARYLELSKSRIGQIEAEIRNAMKPWLDLNSPLPKLTPR